MCDACQPGSCNSSQTFGEARSRKASNRIERICLLCFNDTQPRPASTADSARILCRLSAASPYRNCVFRECTDRRSAEAEEVQTGQDEHHSITVLSHRIH